MIKWQINRILKADIAPLVVATSTLESDDELANYLNTLDLLVVRGSLNDVVERFNDVIDRFNPDYFVRLTADCPLIMPNLLIDMNSQFLKGGLDYLSNTIRPTFPDGLDAEFVNTNAFKIMSKLDLSDVEREHVTIGLYQNRDRFVIQEYNNAQDLSSFRWTVDYPEDLEFVRNVYARFVGRERDFTMEDVFAAVANREIVDNVISHSLRNQAITSPRKDG